MVPRCTIRGDFVLDRLHDIIDSARVDWVALPASPHVVVVPCVVVRVPVATYF